MVKIKVAVLSDVHGNSVALKEAIYDAKKNGATEFIFPGDLVNDLPFGNETLEIMRNTSKYFVYGNKEEYLREYDKSQYTWENLQFKNVIFMYNELSKENLKFILDIPFEIVLNFEGVNIKFVHGSPKGVEDKIKQKDEEVKEKYTKNLKEDALIFGHTHEKMWFERKNGKLLVNAGCCGVSPHYVSTAEYIMLHINNGNIEAEKRFVRYDANELKLKIKKSGILEYDNVLMALTYGGINGHGKDRYDFFQEAKQLMRERHGKLYRDDAKGIFKYFKLFDDDIWLSLYEKYKDKFDF